MSKTDCFSVYEKQKTFKTEYTNVPLSIILVAHGVGLPVSMSLEKWKLKNPFFIRGRWSHRHNLNCLRLYIVDNIGELDVYKRQTVGQTSQV